MPLFAGDRLGPYEILAPLGSGGMGDVYRARDTRLERTVAIKVSKEQFSERFEREARAVAALNHPNICTLHDVGPNYLVMEFLEGAELKGPRPLEKALEYAGQILDALDSAHRNGITHRDLKPANILVTKQAIKLLDFGLAKQSTGLKETDATLTSALTSQGQIIGTLQYMSPEQLQGKEADPRSDLFSFGCVLYEMLTGKRAFEEESAASVIAAILEREPAHLASTAPLERVIRRCLAKDPDERWQTARDLKAEMKWEAAVEPGEAARSPQFARWPQWAGWAATVLLAGALTVMWTLRPGPVAGELVRFTVSPPEKGMFSVPANTTVPVPQFALSPDGSAIVFAAGVAGAKPLLWLRPMAETAAHPLAGTENALLPFWSPDSRWIGFFADNQLKRIPAVGGVVQVLTGDISDVFGGAWGTDDTILFSSGSTGISRIAASGGSPTPATALNASRGDAAHRWPQFLPDGRHFLFFVRARVEHRGVYVGSLDGGGDKLLLKAENNAIYVSPGYLLYVDGETTLAQPFDASRLALTGNRFAIEDRVGRSSTSLGALSASRTGLLAYAGAVLHLGRLTWFDRSGHPSGTVGTEADYTDFRLSPNEQRLALCAVDGKTSNTDIWIADLGRGITSRFTFGSILNSSAIWSPDGGRLLFRANRQGSVVELFQQSADGGGQIQPMLTYARARSLGIRTLAHVPTDWSPDGQSILLSVPSAATGFDIWLLPAAGAGKPGPLIEGDGDQMQGNFSPDGRLVAYTSNESGRFEVYVQTFPLTERKWQVSTTGGTEPRWRNDGGEIYYLSPEEKLIAVTVKAGPSFAVPQTLFQTQVAAQSSVFRTHYVVANNGQRFLLNTQTGEGSGTAITVLLNWTAGLKK